MKKAFAKHVVVIESQSRRRLRHDVILVTSSQPPSCAMISYRNERLLTLTGRREPERLPVRAQSSRIERPVSTPPENVAEPGREYRPLMQTVVARQIHRGRKAELLKQRKCHGVKV